MTGTPYPAGTRVVIVFGPTAEVVGMQGTAMDWHARAGSGDQLPAREGQIVQLVLWDSLAACCPDPGDLERTYPVAWLRPLSDPDAEPVVERQEETA